MSGARMRLWADESVDRAVVERLRRDGYRVTYVAEMAPGISDDAVLTQAQEDRGLLLTADKDFGELVFRLRRLSEGVVLLRLAGLSPERKAGLVAQVFALYAKELAGRFTVISPGGTRIRKDQ